ncbi:flagellar hook-length control protein [Mycobacterium sp. 852002-53434_SCH5985345]|uniref:flagellar hook-length control protein n=1 Tax=Mycobacterium sp. 852002-53434_SCH5985345 TaxID=1834107 RepID=UPI0007FC1DCC|nr:flagellar hook-length control protein [Mycobacterium sp. 852002-53434_SCH5985345]OBF56721.1 flagellar hook-length control protein [Mycobacterium sp. 852002-53434_SCH5985345]
MSITGEDAIRAAASVARDVADGKLNPADLEAQTAAELRQLFGAVIGEDDVAWPVQLDVCRQVLALGGVPADELSEWLAVARHRAGQPEQPGVADAEQHVVADAEQHVVSDAEQDVVSEPEQPAVAEPTPPRRADRYDPLAAWPPSRSLRRPL